MELRLITLNLVVYFSQQSVCKLACVRSTSRTNYNLINLSAAIPLCLKTTFSLINAKCLFFEKFLCTFTLFTSLAIEMNEYKKSHSTATLNRDVQKHIQSHPLKRACFIFPSDVFYVF